MTAHRVPRTRLGFFVTVVVCLTLVMALGAFGGSTAKSGASMLTKAPAAASTKPGVGVTANSIKVGVALVDFDCVKQFVDSIRLGSAADLPGVHRQHQRAGRDRRP